MKHLLCFSAGLGIGVALSVLAAPREGVATREILRRRVPASLRRKSRADQIADDYASHSATEEGMAEGPIQMHR
jgi:hypothetical protein